MTDGRRAQFGVHLPVRVLPEGPRPGTPAGHGLLADIVKSAAANGYASIWVTDHVVYRDPWMDCLLCLASIAGQAGEAGLKIAPGVLGLPLRHPVAMAQTLATLDILSGGNLIIGVGEGSTDLDFNALGLPFDQRRKMLAEAVPLLRRLLEEVEVTHQGQYYSFDKVTVVPKPVQRPYPPIWMSGWGSPAGLRRAALLGDGWVASAWHSTPEQFGRSLGILQEELGKLGKDPAIFPHAVNTLYVYCDPSDQQAQEVAGPTVRHATGGFNVDSGNYIVGDYSRCRELLQRWLDNGARHIAVWPVTHHAEQVSRFAQHVLGHVKVTGTTPKV